MKKFALTCIVNFAAFYTATAVFQEIRVDSAASIFWAGVILTLVNYLVRPLVIVLTLPINLITIGLFTLIVNTWMVMLVDAMIKGITIPGFWISFASALIVSGFNMLLESLIGKKEKP